MFRVVRDVHPLERRIPGEDVRLPVVNPNIGSPFYLVQGLVVLSPNLHALIMILGYIPVRVLCVIVYHKEQVEVLEGDVISVLVHTEWIEERAHQSYALDLVKLKFLHSTQVVNPIHPMLDVFGILDFKLVATVREPGVYAGYFVFALALLSETCVNTWSFVRK